MENSGNFFGGVFSSWGPYMVPRNGESRKLDPKSRSQRGPRLSPLLMVLMTSHVISIQILCI